MSGRQAGGWHGRGGGGVAARRALPLCMLLGAGCTQFLHYTRDLVDAKAGRSWFVRAPAGIGGTLGFVAGVPVDIAVSPVSWAVYRAQPKETRDVLSVFLFPSFVLWQVGTLLGAPFDLIEYAAWRRWHEPELAPEDREAIERHWDGQEYSEYPVRAIHPPAAAGR